MGTFCLWCGLQVFGEVGFVTLIGMPKNETRTRITNFEDAEGSSNQAFRYDQCVELVPGLSGRAQLRYLFCWRALNGHVQVGYDLLHYWGILERSLRTGGRQPSMPLRTLPRDMGFAGPSFGAGISF